MKLNDEVLGFINIVGIFKNKAKVKIFDKEYFFIQPSFWRSTLEVKELNKELPIATYFSKAFRNFGFINLPLGESLKVNFSLLSSQYEIINPFNEVVIKYYNKFSFKFRTEVSIEKDSILLEKYPWIIFIPFYLYQEKRKN